MQTFTVWRGHRTSQLQHSLAGRFYALDADTAAQFSDTHTLTKHSKTAYKLLETPTPHIVAREWKVKRELVGWQRAYLNCEHHHDETCRYLCAGCHAAWYLLDVAIAQEARHRGYDALLYTSWGFLCLLNET